jgi:cytochrome c biogenesis protein
MRLETTPLIEPDDEELLDGSNSPSIPATEIFDRLWRFFISMKTGLVLILSLGILSFAGTMLVQAPAGVVADAGAYATWLETVKPRYGGWTGILDFLGFFSMFSSIIFKTITVLLSISILACSINRAPRLWRVAVHPHTTMSDSFFAHAALRNHLETNESPEVALTSVRRVLKGQKFRIVDDQKNGELNIYADRFRWGPFGTVMAHLSFILIVIGVMLSGSTGFKDTQFTAPVGSRVPVGHNSGLTLEAQSFNATYYEDGSPKDYSSEIVLYRGNQVVQTKTIRVNHPMSYAGISFYQSFFGIAASMRVVDAAGKEVFNAGVPLVWSSDDGKHSIGQFDIVDRARSIYVISAASGEVDPNIKAGQMQIEVHKSGVNEAIATEVLSQGRPLTVDGLTYTFQRTRQFTGLIVAHDPGAPFVWLGSALLVFGTVLVFFFPHRRIWVRVRKIKGGSQIDIASTKKRDNAFEPKFHQIVTEIQPDASLSNNKKGR